MEASALQHAARLPALAGRSPLLRLQGDEKLIALTRRGHQGAFEALVQRYQPRLLAFCRHMLGSQEDAEDVLQEVFAAAFNAICADDRPINARPWLYRISRNRCLNHLRRPQPAGQDSMDVFERDGGVTTADTVHRREELRHIVGDVQELPETQRTALLLREIDALSYDQIAEAMDTTVPSVKSLLVRARVSLAEASEARLLTCEEVRLELAQVAEGIARPSAPVRRHVKGCERCRTFRDELRNTSKALSAVLPVGPFLFLKKIWIAKLGMGGAAGAAASGGGGAAAGAGVGGVAASAAGSIGAGGAVSAGISAFASKTAAGMAAAVIVTAGAVEVRQATQPSSQPPQPEPEVAAAPPTTPPPAPQPAPATDAEEDERSKRKRDRRAIAARRRKQEAERKGSTATAPEEEAASETDEQEPEEEPTETAPEDAPEEQATAPAPAPGEPTKGTAPPGEGTTTTKQPVPAPPAGEPEGESGDGQADDSSGDTGSSESGSSGTGSSGDDGSTADGSTSGSESSEDGATGSASGTGAGGGEGSGGGETSGSGGALAGEGSG